MDYKKEIIDFCRLNRVSTTEVADALGKKGVLSGVSPINLGKFCVGPVRIIIAADNSNYLIHEQVRDVRSGEVVIIFAHSCEGRALIGDLISKYVLLYRDASCIVVKGMVRDAARLRRESYSIWAEGVTPLGCFNMPGKEPPADFVREVEDDYAGGVAICDDGGVTIIREDLLNASTLERLQNIEVQEDIWFYCLDTLKWDTKKIVCDKDYLKEQGFFSKVHVEQMRSLPESLDPKR